MEIFKTGIAPYSAFKVKQRRFFTQKTATLVNGQKVRKGDLLSFINSDGKKCVGEVKLDGKRLFFWNNMFDFQDYPDAKKETML